MKLITLNWFSFLPLIILRKCVNNFIIYFSTINNLTKSCNTLYKLQTFLIWHERLLLDIRIIFLGDPI